MNVDVEANITTTTTNVTAETNIITNMNVNATVMMMPATAAEKMKIQKICTSQINIMKH